MATLIENALLLDLDPPHVEHGALRIDGNKIIARGIITPAPGDETIDAAGCLVLPGLVNGHTHLYSALAVGMPPPPRPPANFLEILELIWWRLDRALDPESIELSARIGALEALRCGTTTLIDHHASPNCIPGSLDLIERGLASVGLRGVLCYETTDRNGRAGRDAGLAENARYLDLCNRRRDPRFAALVGAHASFTLAEDTLAELAAMADEFETGVHIHVAEDPCDEAACRRDHNIGLLERLERHRILRPASIIAHGTHLSPAEIDMLSASGATLAHNPRSNMNNAVGHTPIARHRGPIMLGTDGIGADMFAESAAAWFKSRDAQYFQAADHFRAATVTERQPLDSSTPPSLAPNDILAMLAASARRASAALGITLGKLQTGAAADIILTDYHPATPLTAENLAAHFIFALSSRHVRSVMVDGQWLIRDRVITSCNESSAQSHARRVAERLWKGMASL